MITIDNYALDIDKDRFIAPDLEKGIKEYDRYVNIIKNPKFPMAFLIAILKEVHKNKKKEDLDFNAFVYWLGGMEVFYEKIKPLQDMYDYIKQNTSDQKQEVKE